MAFKGDIQSTNRSLIGNPEAEEILRELMSQHRTRKSEDPVGTLNSQLQKILFTFFVVDS